MFSYDPTLHPNINYIPFALQTIFKADKLPNVASRENES